MKELVQNLTSVSIATPAVNEGIKYGNNKRHLIKSQLPLRQLM